MIRTLSTIRRGVAGGSGYLSRPVGANRTGSIIPSSPRSSVACARCSAKELTSATLLYSIRPRPFRLVLTLDGPTSEARAAYDAHLALVGRMHWQAMAPGVLDRDCRDFDVLDDASIQRAGVANGTLRIGDECYRAIVLTAYVTLEAATSRVLQRFVEAGGLLVAVGAVPEAGGRSVRGGCCS